MSLRAVTVDFPFTALKLSSDTARFLLPGLAGARRRLAYRAGLQRSISWGGIHPVGPCPLTRDSSVEWFGANAKSVSQTRHRDSQLRRGSGRNSVTTFSDQIRDEWNQNGGPDTSIAVRPWRTVLCCCTAPTAKLNRGCDVPGVPLVICFVHGFISCDAAGVWQIVNSFRNSKRTIFSCRRSVPSEEALWRAHLSRRNRQGINLREPVSREEVESLPNRRELSLSRSSLPNRPFPPSCTCRSAVASHLSPDFPLPTIS